MKEIVFFEIEELKEHEEIRPDYLETLKNEIMLDGILKMPITVDKNTCIILDGYHRLHALKRSGCRKIPVVLVDYQSPEIEVIAWREGETMTKEKIIERFKESMGGLEFLKRCGVQGSQNRGRAFPTIQTVSVGIVEQPG